MKKQFPDPTIYPVVFSQKEKEQIFLSIKEFPVSFAFYQHPRPAFVASMVVEQLETLFISQDIYKDEKVAIFNKNYQHTIELLATNVDITKTNFNLKFNIDNESFKAIKTGQIQTINQPTGTKIDISHLFSMSDSTVYFDAYDDDGTYFYPTASLKLEFYPYVKNTSYTWTDIILPDKQTTPVKISPINCYGILDILASVYIRWYYDEERTIPAPSPITLSDFKFGIRFCISNKGSLFKNSVQIGLQGTAIASSLYSNTTLHDFDQYASHNIFYWGQGENFDDLFYGSVSNIEIADNGLPVQLGRETAVYLLDNPLPDIDSSSSSSYSISSLSSSTTSGVNTSSSSTSSVSSTLSISSLTSSLSSSTSSSTSSSLGTSSSSSVSPSTFSSLTSSSTEISAFSSSSSSSTSTGGMDYSSSSSSIEQKVIFYYGFSSKYDEFWNIADESGNGHTAKITQTKNPPTWSNVGGIHGGRYIFTPYGNSVQYIQSSNLLDFSSLNKGTISLWAKLSTVSMLTSSSLFAITVSPPVENTTEFILGLSIGSTKEIVSSVSIDGEIKWALNAELTTSFVNNWYNFVIVHNGTEPSLYINGVIYPFTFSVPDYKSFWIDSLFRYFLTNKANTLMLSATSRNYYPYITAGFNGELDEVKMWNTNLSSASVYDEYTKIRG